MYFCPNCGAKSEQLINFCSNCGSKMEYSEPSAPVAPAYTQPAPVYNQPTPSAAPAYSPADMGAAPLYSYAAPVSASKSSTAGKIVGMALSAVGLLNHIIGFFYTTASMPDEELAFAMALSFALICTPLSIVGLILSNKNNDGGNLAIFSRLGKIFGFIGIGLAAVYFTIGFVLLMSVM